MDTRDRIEEYSSNKRKGIEDKKSLLGDYIKAEEFGRVLLAMLVLILVQ